TSSMPSANQDSDSSCQTPQTAIGPLNHHGTVQTPEDVQEEEGDFLTTILNLIPQGMRQIPTHSQGQGQDPNSDQGLTPPLPLYDYQSEFTRRQPLTKGGNGQIRLAYWSSRQCSVTLKSLIDTKHTPEKAASLFDKEASCS